MTSQDGGGSSLNYHGWNKARPTIFLRSNVVAWSNTWEYKVGTILQPEEIEQARVRGYNIALTESTLAPDVATTVSASAANVDKRVPPEVLLIESDLDRITGKDLDLFIWCLEQCLVNLEREYAAEDQEWLRYTLITEKELLLEEFVAKKANRTSTARKIASAKRYRSKKISILRKKKEAVRKKTHEIARKKRAMSHKTRLGKAKKTYNKESTLAPCRNTLHHGNNDGLFAAFMEMSLKKNRVETRMEVNKWLTPKPKMKFVVEFYDVLKGENIQVEAEVYMIRKIKEINEALNGNK